ncbi:hypothetical protein DsansV1_C35g0229991 [Dioscorea sansibarensis]
MVPMSTLHEITRLFAFLASDLRRSKVGVGAEGDEFVGAVSALTRSLNPGDECQPRVRVLDAALSLMCFKSPEVCHARIEATVQTIDAVLSSLASCKVIRLSGGCGELLQVGNSISYEDCNKLIRTCGDVFESLEGCDGLSCRLLYAAFKAALSSSHYSSLFPFSSTLCDKNGQGSDGSSEMKSVVSKLTNLLSEEYCANNHDEVPMRLILWYLDPLILKHDISEILREKIERPFLCLKKELHNRPAWCSITLCLVASPIAFAETRTLLHNWFLLTGLASILEVKAAIVSAVLDVLSKPMGWGLSMEWGLKFPFSYAYFLNVHQDLLSILTGPVSGERFLDLVHHIVMASSSAEKQICPSKSSQSISEHGVFEYTTIAYNSNWTILMDFPVWFYYATALMFCQKDSLDSVPSKGMHADAAGSKELHEAAVLFISWVLCPLNQVHFDMLVSLLNDMSRLWTFNYLANSGYEQRPSSDSHNKTSRGKRLRISKVSTYEKSHTTQPHDSSLIGLWLTEFKSHCSRFYSIFSEGKPRQSSRQEPNLLLRKVPLGILISCPSDLDERGSELVLHFASTGEILNQEGRQKNSNCHHSYDNYALCYGGIYGNWALDGVCLVLDLMDMMEDISVFLFHCEETRFDFVGHVKGNASSYLLHCVKVLLDLQFELFQSDESQGGDTLLDLYKRLMHWKDQFKKPFEGLRLLDAFLDNFARRFRFFGYQDKVS